MSSITVFMERVLCPTPTIAGCFQYNSLAQQTGHLNVEQASAHKKIFRKEHLAEQRPSRGSLEARCCHLLGEHQELLRWQAVSCSPAVSQHPSNTGCGLKEAESLQSDGNCNRAPRDGPVYLASSA